MSQITAVDDAVLLFLGVVQIGLAYVLLAWFPLSRHRSCYCSSLYSIGLGLAGPRRRPSGWAWVGGTVVLGATA
ncbi:MAG: hypothetical protein U0V87_04340 [Acidobacteriota bacterium]